MAEYQNIFTSVQVSGRSITESNCHMATPPEPVMSR
jgi:hypothetical protein